MQTTTFFRLTEASHTLGFALGFAMVRTISLAACGATCCVQQCWFEGAPQLQAEKLTHSFCFRQSASDAP